MKAKKLDAVEVCKELEDVLAPQLKLSILDRSVYSHLLRHSRFEDKLRLRFSIPWLAHNLGITTKRARDSVRRLVDKSVLRLIERGNVGHLVEPRLPAEVRVPAPGRTRLSGPRKPPGEANLDELDFLHSYALRQSIHARARGVCFYCLRLTPRRARCLDHVVPLASLGSNSYRNLVSCCLNCNSRKNDRPAEDFLRLLYRERTLSRKDLSKNLKNLRALAAGKLRPHLRNHKDLRPGRGKLKEVTELRKIAAPVNS